MRRSASNFSWFTFAAAFLIQWALWLAFTDDVGYREIVAGFLGAAISATAGAVYSMQGKCHFRFRLKDVAQGWRIPWQAIKDTWAIFRAIWTLGRSKKAGSLLAAVPFEPGRPGDPLAEARRALAVTYTTITPNVIVLGIVREQGLMLYHQIVGDPSLEIARRLGAKP